MKKPRDYVINLTNQPNFKFSSYAETIQSIVLNKCQLSTMPEQLKFFPNLISIQCDDNFLNEIEAFT